MNSLKIARGSDGKITKISRHVTRNDILKGLALGIVLLVLGGFIFGEPQTQGSLGTGLEMEAIALVLCGVGLFIVSGCVNRLFAPATRDIRVADTNGLQFFLYGGAMENVPWSDIRSYRREPAPLPGWGKDKELLIVQLRDPEKYLARLRSRAIVNEQLPGGKRELPFATLASSSVLDLNILENALRQLLAQQDITLASPTAAEFAPRPVLPAVVETPQQKTTSQKYLPLAAIGVGIVAALVYGVLMVRSGHRTNFAVPMLITVLTGMAARSIAATLHKSPAR